MRWGAVDAWHWAAPTLAAAEKSADSAAIRRMQVGW